MHLAQTVLCTHYMCEGATRFRNLILHTFVWMSYERMVSVRCHKSLVSDTVLLTALCHWLQAISNSQSIQKACVSVEEEQVQIEAL